MAKPEPRGSSPKVPPRSSGRPPGARRPSARAQANRRRRTQRNIAIAASVAVIVAVVVLIVVKVSSGPSGGSAARPPVSAADLSTVTGVPVSTLVAAAGAAASGAVNPPAALPAGTPPLQSAGKPELFYLGAEYCPYCAAERWPLVMALSKFGTFQSLASTKSSSTDVNANTPTFSFYGSSYQSPYLVFTSVEQQDRLGKNLQSATTAQDQLVSTYDTPPYTSQRGVIPFIDFGGKFLVSGSEYNGAALAGKSFSAAVSYMTSASNPTSRAAEAVAGHLLGVICAMTGDQPATVCSTVPANLKTGVSTATNQGSSSGG